MDPAPNGPRANGPAWRVGASRPGQAWRHREARADPDRRGQAVGVVEAAHPPAQRVGGDRHECGRRREQPRRGAGDDLGCHGIGHAEGGAELERVHERPRGALERDRRPRARQRRARRRATLLAGRRQPAARAALVAQEAQLAPAPPAERLAGRHARAAIPARGWGERRAEGGEQITGGGEHPPMLARDVSRRYRAIETILRSGCGRFVDVRPRCCGARRPGGGGVRPALATRAPQARPARRARRPPDRLRRRPARTDRRPHLAHRPARRAVVRHAHGPAHPAARRRADPPHRKPHQGHPAPGHAALAAPGARRPARSRTRPQRSSSTSP